VAEPYVAGGRRGECKFVTGEHRVDFWLEVLQSPLQQLDALLASGVCGQGCQPSQFLFEFVAPSHARVGGGVLFGMMLGMLRVTQFLPGANVLLWRNGDLVAECPARLTAVWARHLLWLLRRSAHSDPAGKADPGRVGHSSVSLHMSRSHFAAAMPRSGCCRCHGRLLHPG
jgi:hypothetical protein